MSLFEIQRLVVPIDFSEETTAAIVKAVDIADGDPSKVYLVHVLAEMSPADPGVLWGEISDANRARHVQQAVLEQGLHPNAEMMHIEVVFGDAGFRIADYAKKIAADLVVISSHGRTGMRHLLMGSVAERVIRYVHCPVLVLRRACAPR